MVNSIIEANGQSIWYIHLHVGCIRYEKSLCKSLLQLCHTLRALHHKRLWGLAGIPRSEGKWKFDLLKPGILAMVAQDDFCFPCLYGNSLAPKSA